MTTTVNKSRGELQRELDVALQEIARLAAENKWFKEQFLLLRHRQFGASSEKNTAGQGALSFGGADAVVFNEAEAEADPQAPEPTAESAVVAGKRAAKTKGKRKEQLASLPVKEHEIVLSAEQQLCPKCQEQMHRMCWKEHKEVEFIPAHLSITNYKQAVYSCRRCEREAVHNPIVEAPMPPLAFPGSLASPSLVSEIMGRKYVDGTPLYRQEPLWLAQGLQLTRQTMANWVIRGAHEWLSIIFERMHELLLCRDTIKADETTMQVLREEGRAAQTSSYLWQYRSGRDGPPIVLFEYQLTRGGEHPKRFLKDFTGNLQTDGWQAYEKVRQDRDPDLPVTLSGCWAHARRYFHDALLTLPEPERELGTSTAHVGLDYCNQLFAIEAQLHDCSNEDRLAGRLEFSKPVVDRMHAWILRVAPETLPKSALGKAFTYHINQWDKLVMFLTDGSLEIDNNSSERAIRGVVTGRKNWLFATCPRGAQASAIIYSIVMTAKENHLDPRLYLKYLLEQLPAVTAGDQAKIDKLLPWAEQPQTELTLKARDPRPLQNWKRRQKQRQ